MLAALAAAVPSAASAQTTSNFGMVGFDLDLKDEQSFARSITKIAESCEEFDRLDADDVLCMVQDRNGGQIWIGLRETQGSLKFVAANPALVGKSEFPATVEERVSDRDWEPFEYQLSVRFGEENVPLLVALADPRDADKYAEIAEPQALVLDLTAFTFNPEIYETPEAFTEAETSEKVDILYAENFFIPTGLFGDQPAARASFAGEVLEAELLTNEFGSTHWRTLVKVLGGGTVNVVFDDISIDVEPQPGNLLTGDFWLSAHVR